MVKKKKTQLGIRGSCLEDYSSKPVQANILGDLILEISNIRQS
jgi:hypothetical protein